MSAYAQLEIQYVINFTEQYFATLPLYSLQIDATLKLNAWTFICFHFWH